MIKQGQYFYEFGPFRLDPSERLLTRDGQPVALTPRAFETLLALVRNAGHLVTKEELMKAVWGDAFVEPGNLVVTISVLRKALAGDGAKYVETVSKLGYRFVGEVREGSSFEPVEIPQVPGPAPVQAAAISAGAPRALWLASFLALLTVLALGMALGRSKSLVGSGRAASPNKKAHQLYLYGRHFWNRRTPEALQKSISFYQQALIEDPNYAAAYAGLADSYTLLSSLGPVESMPPRARAAALRALELDSSSADAHAALGFASLSYERNWAAAERELRAAVSLDPNNATAHQRYGLALAAMGRMSESLDQMKRAVEADPLSLIVNADMGWALYLNRRYDEAITAYRRVLDLDPQFIPAHTFLGLAHVQKAEFAAAIQQFNEARRLGGDRPHILGELGYARARAGETAAAEEALRELVDRSRREYIPPFSMALICIGLGRNEEAVKWLEDAYKAHNSATVYAKSDPALDPLRSDPRFVELLQRVGF